MLLFSFATLYRNLEMFAMKQCERENIYAANTHLAIIAFPYILVTVLDLILVSILEVVCFVTMFSFHPRLRLTVCDNVPLTRVPHVQ